MFVTAQRDPLSVVRRPYKGRTVCRVCRYPFRCKVSQYHIFRRTVVICERCGQARQIQRFSRRIRQLGGLGLHRYIRCRLRRRCVERHGECKLVAFRITAYCTLARSPGINCRRQRAELVPRRCCKLNLRLVGCPCLELPSGCQCGVRPVAVLPRELRHGVCPGSRRQAARRYRLGPRSRSRQPRYACFRNGRDIISDIYAVFIFIGSHIRGP